MDNEWKIGDFVVDMYCNIAYIQNTIEGNDDSPYFSTVVLQVDDNDDLNSISYLSALSLDALILSGELVLLSC